MQREETREWTAIPKEEPRSGTSKPALGTPKKTVCVQYLRKGRSRWRLSRPASPLLRQRTRPGVGSLWDWLTPMSITQKADPRVDGRSLQQWRSIQGKYWLEVQRVQVRSSLTRAQRSTQKKRRRHNEGRVALKNGVAATQLRTRRPRHPRSTHERNALDVTKCHHPDPTYTSRPTLPFIFTVLPSACTVVMLMTSCTMSAPPFISRSLAAFGSKLEFHMVLTVSRFCATWLTVATPVSALEKRVRNPGPATHNRDRPAADQRSTGHRRLDEAGHSVPGSQGSVTEGVQNLRISDSPTTQTAPPAPPPMPNARRRPQARPKQQPREYLRCAQCGSNPAAFRAVIDTGRYCF